MKTKHLFTAIALATGFTAGAQTASIAYNETSAVASRAIEPAKRVEAKPKAAPQRNVVNLYSRKEKGTLVITSRRKQEVQLFIFDLEGTILYKTPLRQNEKARITELAKGSYSYTIFDGDESVEHGTLTIK